MAKGDTIAAASHSCDGKVAAYGVLGLTRLPYNLSTSITKTPGSFSTLFRSLSVQNMASIPQDLPTIVPEDETFTDPGYDSDSTAASYATSLASEIRRGVEENGRVYASFGKHEAQLPQDDEEKNRNDLQHCKFRLLLGDKLHLAPIAKNPTKVLDLGTGTGT